MSTPAKAPKHVRCLEPEEELEPVGSPPRDDSDMYHQSFYRKTKMRNPAKPALQGTGSQRRAGTSSAAAASEEMDTSVEASAAVKDESKVSLEMDEPSMADDSIMPDE